MYYFYHCYSPIAPCLRVGYSVREVAVSSVELMSAKGKSVHKVLKVHYYDVHKLMTRTDILK